MFCPNCGTKNDDGTIFCANCGTGLKGQASGGGTNPPPMANTNMGGGAAPSGIPPKNWMTEAILATVFGFLCSCLGGIFGIVAIVQASNVNKRFQLGDLAGAENAAKQAKLWTMIAAGITAVIFVIYMIINGFAFFSILNGDYSGY